MRTWSLWSLLGLCACGGASRPVHLARTTPAASKPSTCPVVVDVADLLARHGHAYGTPLLSGAALPHTLVGTLASGSKAGVFELVIDRARYRKVTSVDSLRVARGFYNQGAWSLGVTGALVELAPGEAADIAFEEWLTSRAYIDDAFTDAACSQETGADARPVIILRSARDDVGKPELRFDAVSAELLSASSTKADGVRATRTFGAWGSPDATGVRWPTMFTEGTSGGDEARVTIQSSLAGAHCGTDNHSQEGDVCFRPPPPRLSVHWPPSGLVRVPMDYVYGELLLRVRMGPRSVWALLDSGAGVSVIEAASAGAAGFKPIIEGEGQGLTQRVQMGLGELDSVSIGELELLHLPVASVPIPAFDDFGAKRPELVLGYTLFETMAVRVDYAKREVLVAQSADTLPRAADAVAVPFRSLDSKPVVEGQIEGHPALIELDTGNNGTFDLSMTSAQSLGLFDGRPTAELHGRFGVGTAEAKLTLLRVARVRMGPIDLLGSLTAVGDRPSQGAVGAFAGNRALGACTAVLFDFVHRSLWVDPPCDRTAKEETRVGWRLTRRDAPTAPDRPWVIGSIVRDSAADRAGLKEGDRLLEVGRVPATLDSERIVALTDKPVGTRLPVVVERSGERKHVVLTLADLLK